MQQCEMQILKLFGIVNWSKCGHHMPTKMGRKWKSEWNCGQLRFSIGFWDNLSMRITTQNIYMRSKWLYRNDLFHNDWKCHHSLIFFFVLLILSSGSSRTVISYDFDGFFCLEFYSIFLCVTHFQSPDTNAHRLNIKTTSLFRFGSNIFVTYKLFRKNEDGKRKIFFCHTFSMCSHITKRINCLVCDIEIQSLSCCCHCCGEAWNADRERKIKVNCFNRTNNNNINKLTRFRFFSSYFLFFIFFCLLFVVCAENRKWQTPMVHVNVIASAVHNNNNYLVAQRSLMSWSFDFIFAAPCPCPACQRKKKTHNNEDDDDDNYQLLLLLFVPFCWPFSESVHWALTRFDFIVFTQRSLRI